MAHGAVDEGVVGQVQVRGQRSEPRCMQEVSHAQLGNKPPKELLLTSSLHHISNQSTMAAKFELPFTQPSTIVAFLCTLLIAVFVSPIGQSGGLDTFSTTVRLFHLFSFASWLGVQIWVTFFAGAQLMR